MNRNAAVIVNINNINVRGAFTLHEPHFVYVPCRVVRLGGRRRLTSDSLDCLFHKSMPLKTMFCFISKSLLKGLR